MAKPKSSGNKITEQELMQYLALVEQYEEARKNVNQIEKAVKGIEENIIDRLKKGEKIEGSINALVVQEQGSCRPAWKEEYLLHMEGHGVQRETAILQVQQRTEIPVKDILKVAYKAKV